MTHFLIFLFLSSKRLSSVNFMWSKHIFALQSLNLNVRLLEATEGKDYPDCFAPWWNYPTYLPYRCHCLIKSRWFCPLPSFILHFSIYMELLGCLLGFLAHYVKMIGKCLLLVPFIIKPGKKISAIPVGVRSIATIWPQILWFVSVYQVI